MAGPFIGTSGWTYAHWRGGAFYPPRLPQRCELEHAAARFTALEINGTFYGQQRPESFRRWAAAVPPGFPFAVKGHRYITHLKQLNDVRLPLANFLASGVLALGDRLGPILWQFPQRFRFNPEKLERFFALLPQDTEAAAALAAEHEAGRMEGRAWTATDARRPLRHAVEVRHESFQTPDFVAMLRRWNVMLVVSDAPGWPAFADAPGDGVYLRLHGAEQLYASRYDDRALDIWAARIRRWMAGEEPEDLPRIAAREA
ncbi:MAG TPA: DUF72 domain-containing protein, partial [Alphaproteobacteria bacterium]|nr:DUF72 domain-containing protein [Alphaproteobacteria bacterium]